MQILFVTERQHWVATHYHNGEVNLYVSLSNGRLSPSLQEQLVQIYKPAIKKGGLLVTVMPVQQQTGSTDCGLFSIAYAYHAACGDNLARMVLDQTQIGSHLLVLLYNHTNKLVCMHTSSFRAWDAIQTRRRRYYS